MAVLNERGELVNTLKKVHYSHDAMVDLIIAQPSISQNQIAQHFDKTPAWISIIVNSDAFKNRLAERKDEVIDPILRTSLEERIRGCVDLSLQVLQEKLRANPNPNLAVRVLEHGTRALGFGARVPSQAVQVITYVAVVPAKSLSAEAWATEHNPRPVIDAPAG